MSQDPKFTFHDGYVWANEGKYVIPTDEPLVLFRGKDEGTPVVMRAYLAWLQTQGEHEGVRAAHIASITERIETIEAWQAAYPERVGMGCHTCANGSHRVRTGVVT